MRSSAMILLAMACQTPSGQIRHAPLSGLAPIDPEGNDPSTSSTSSTPSSTTSSTSSSTTSSTSSSTAPSDPLYGFIGSPCASDADCPYDGGVCLKESEGFPRGTCSAPCTSVCDDAEGHPTTFCAEIDALPEDVSWLGDGGCLSRCDFGLYPYDGCRADYGCVKTARANEPESETYVCLPEVSSDLSDCIADLAARGVPFSPTLIPDAAPDGYPSLTCHVEDPIVFASGYLGVDIQYYSDTEPGTVQGACSLGTALADTIEDLSLENVTTLRHIGTYVCRTISGSSSLSRHAYGDAIDIYGFTFANGDQYTLVDDWEHETTSFDTTAGQWLYDTAYRWHDEAYWNIILTPNYNSDHDNHFHVDLTPGSDFIGLTDFRYIGPSPWEGE